MSPNRAYPCLTRDWQIRIWPAPRSRESASVWGQQLLGYSRQSARRPVLVRTGVGRLRSAFGRVRRSRRAADAEGAPAAGRRILHPARRHTPAFLAFDASPPAPVTRPLRRRTPVRTLASPFRGRRAGTCGGSSLVRKFISALVGGGRLRTDWARTAAWTGWALCRARTNIVPKPRDSASDAGLADGAWTRAWTRMRAFTGGNNRMPEPHPACVRRNGRRCLSGVRPAAFGLARFRHPSCLVSRERPR